MPVKSIIQVPGVRVSALARIPALPVRLAPGPAGVNGLNGANGPPGLDGDDGEAWIPGPTTAASGGGGDPWVPAAMTPPPTFASGAWTQFANVTQTLEDFTSGISGVRLRGPMEGVNTTTKIAGAHMAIPGTTTWSVTVRIRNSGYLYTAGSMAWGILLYDSVGGRMFTYGPAQFGGGVISRWKMNSGTSFNGTDNFLGTSGINMDVFMDLWLRIVVDATNYTYYMSRDGQYWVLTHAALAKNDFLTNPANRVGFGYNYQNINFSGEGVLEVGSWFAG